MAVAFSTGGSGYTRSDFMISDAALPQRVEEAVQADQSDRFSQVLSGISGKNDAPKDVVKTVEKFTGNDGKVDMHELAKAVADGEVKLEDIPEELLTQELFTELTQLIKVPEKEDGEPTKEAAQEAMSELAALFTAQQTVHPDNVSDKSAELSELAQPVEAVQAPEVTQEQPIQAVQTEQPAEVQTETVAEVFPQVVQEEAQPVQTEQPRAQRPAENTEQTAPVQTEAAPQAVQPESESASQQDSSGTELPAQTQAVQQPTSEEPQRSDITEFTVRTAEPKPQQTESAEPQQEAPVFTEHSQRSRVVSKSDELEMIKGTADNTKTDTAQVQPQTTQAEAPVVFTRADGGEIQVRPAEVVKQVADRLIERASDLKEGETEYTVTLEPQDLGRITVRMVKTADGAVSVSIAAENSKTLRIIEENGAHIQDSLKQNGVQLENWQTVSESRQDMHAEDYQSSSKNPYQEHESDKQEDDSDDKSFAEIIASM